MAQIAQEVFGGGVRKILGVSRGLIPLVFEKGLLDGMQFEPGVCWKDMGVKTPHWCPSEHPV